MEGSTIRGRAEGTKEPAVEGRASDQVVLATKLFPPRVKEGLVVRERLLDRLRRGLDGPLTVVVAPAGWGKSTLVSNLLRVDAAPAGWLSLDRGDDDPNGSGATSWQRRPGPSPTPG